MTTLAFRDDPEWRQARQDYVDDERDGEDPDEVYARRVKAAVQMRDIEKQHKAHAEP